MGEIRCQYLIVGANLTGGSAIAGIRERDPDGSILLIGRERRLPYHRPPLSKKLWSGKTTVEKIFLKPQGYYDEQHVDVRLGAEATGLDAEGHVVTDALGNTYRYERLLLATGGAPRRLSIPGADLEGLCYYRYLDDYLATRARAAEGKSAAVIGGGFIGSEMAAALTLNMLRVTMIYPEPYIVARVFPEGLGRALQQQYRARGVTILNGDLPAVIERKGEKWIITTKNGARVESDIAIVGIGIAPSLELARAAGLTVGNGIVVNEYLQTSDPDIFAAGDNAFCPYRALGKSTRIEHWDAALSQGQHAGRNMAGAGEPFTYMPYFFSDLFEFGYEAVGEVDSRLETFADWQKENDTGVIYYLEGGKVRGAMMCNVWEKVDAARELIARGARMTREKLRGAVR